MNVTCLVNTGGEAVERYMYDPYGRMTVLNGAKNVDKDGAVTEWTADTVQTASDVSNSVLYCGYYHDWETGLYCVRHRYYDPPLGRWVQRDPLGYTRGMALCEYGASHPTCAVDPLGLREVVLHVMLHGKLPPVTFEPNSERIQQNLATILSGCFGKLECDTVVLKVERTQERKEEKDLGLFPRRRLTAYWFGPIPIPYLTQDPATSWEQEVHFQEGEFPLGGIAATFGPRTLVGQSGADQKIGIICNRPTGAAAKRKFSIAWANVLAHEILYIGIWGRSDVLIPSDDTPLIYQGTGICSRLYEIPKEMCDALKTKLGVK
jgi:RHS repeat-associated protein